MDAGKSTHNRLELGKEHDESEGNRYSKISWDEEKIEDLFCQIFLESFNVKAIFVGGTAGRSLKNLALSVASYRLPGTRRAAGCKLIRTLSATIQN